MATTAPSQRCFYCWISGNFGVPFRDGAMTSAVVILSCKTQRLTSTFPKEPYKGLYGSRFGDVKTHGGKILHRIPPKSHVLSSFYTMNMMIFLGIHHDHSWTTPHHKPLTFLRSILFTRSIHQWFLFRCIARLLLSPELSKSGNFLRSGIFLALLHRYNPKGYVDRVRASRESMSM